MRFDFTLNKYRHFCKNLKSLSCPIFTVKDFMAGNCPDTLCIILRHDVDRWLSAAIRMAKLEAEYDIRASYYVRMTRGVFKPVALKQISSLGHEIGYHYEVLTKAKGNLGKAIEIFERELNALREVVAVSTISMHGSPLSRWNNLNLWDRYDFKNYGVDVEASLSINYTNIYYFTDTGRSWNADRFNLRDRVNSRKPIESIQTTDQLIDFINKKYPFPVMISAHPNRWAANSADFIISHMSDGAANWVKWLFSLARK
jgi:hypothetical protein